MLGAHKSPPITAASDPVFLLLATVWSDFSKHYFWRGFGRHPASGRCISHAVGITFFGDLMYVPT